jgi:predicted ester cyclase
MRIQPLVLAAALAVAQIALPASARGPADRPTAAAAASQTEHNKATARRVYEEGLNQGRFEVPYTPDFVGHGGGRTFTRDEGLAEARGFRAAFPDLAFTVDHAVAEGDLVAVRWTARGTNTGEGNGIPATGRRVQVSGTALFRFEDGAIAEEWTAGDTLGLMRQLGLLPAPGARPSPAAAPPSQ